MPTLGIVGFGSFGQFMASHLRSHFEIAAYDRLDLTSAAAVSGVRWAPLREVAGADVVALAVPVQDLEGVLRQMQPWLRPPTLVIDVASVKVKPMALMERWLEPALEVVGTHPLFGPQSGRDGIAGLKIVLCPLRCRRQRTLRAFLERTLGLEVYEMSAERHDREMAYIQGVTHFIARALVDLKMPDSQLATVAYRHLLRIEEILRHDSRALFHTIERENPFVAAARRQLLDKLGQIECELTAEPPVQR